MNSVWFILITLILIIAAYRVGKESAEQEQVDLRCNMEWVRYNSNMKAAIGKINHLNTIIAGYQRGNRTRYGKEDNHVEENS